MMAPIQVSAWFLTSLAATESGETREGIAYAGMMGECDLQTFIEILAFNEKLGFITRGPNHLVKVTAKGKEFAAKIEQVLEMERKRKATEAGA